jgi:hypothetical protein
VSGPILLRGAGGGGGGGGDFTKIEHIDVDDSAPLFVEFTTLPQTFESLRLICRLASTSGNLLNTASVQFNGVTTTIYDTYGINFRANNNHTGTWNISQTGLSFGFYPGWVGYAGVGILDLVDYKAVGTGITNYKHGWMSVDSIGDRTNDDVRVCTRAWQVRDENMAISSIKIIDNVGWREDCKFTLYGLS